MTLDEISLSDCIILKITKKNKIICIEFEQVFDIENKKFIKNCTISIMNWDIFIIKLFISSEPFSALIEKTLNENDFEAFEMIHEVELKGKELILKGFSKNSGYWMEWKFINSVQKIEFGNR